MSETVIDDGLPDLDSRRTPPDRNKIVIEYVAERFWKPTFATAIDVAICLDLTA